MVWSLTATELLAVPYATVQATILLGFHVPDPGVVQHSGPMSGGLKGVTKFLLSLKKPSFPDALKCCHWRPKFKYYSLQ